MCAAVLIVERIRPAMSDSDGRTELIQAPVADIVAALLDFENYPQWQTGVLECTVQEHDEQQRGRLVAFHVDAKVRRVRYLARYFYDLEQGRLGWDYVSGDLKNCTGRYQLSPQTPNATRVSINIVTELGFFLPRPVMKVVRDQALKNSMRDLKRRVMV